MEPQFRDYSILKNFKFDDERVSTITSREQQKTENSIEKFYDRYQQLQYLCPKVAKFFREEHQRYVEAYLRRLPTNYECLDSSRPWNVYWILNAAHLLSFNFNDELLGHAVEFLKKCRSPDGGFAGGPGQYPHLAPTYAAVNSLCMIGTESAYRAIDRDSLVKFLWAIREPDGSFRLHVDGETDVRGAYCAISCAKLTNVPEEEMNKLFAGTADWIASCQTYEGGFGGAPDLEAHGGYTFCAISALALLNEGNKNLAYQCFMSASSVGTRLYFSCDSDSMNKINVPIGEQLINQPAIEHLTSTASSSLIIDYHKWALGRQMPFEGGFQGRTNKLVDGCYSFWVGAILPIVQAIISKEGFPIKSVLFDPVALQEYILLCCQKPHGGLIDKPGKPQDLYHTCYTLSGVSIAQHCESSLHPLVLGDPCNELLPTHPLFNVPPQSVSRSFQHFEEINSRGPADRSVRSESADSTSKSKNGDETPYESEDNTEDNSTTPSSVSSY